MNLINIDLKMKSVIIILYCALTSAVGVNQNYVHNLMSGEWFELHRIPAVWKDAMMRCQLKGSILASPINEEMKNGIRTMLLINQVSKKVFIGIQAVPETKYSTSIEGVVLEDMPVRWEREDLPMTSHDECLTMSHAGYIDSVPCNVTRPYLCLRNNSDKREQCGGNGYQLYKTGSCYKFHTECHSWNDAFRICAAELAHLVIINSDEEVEVINYLFSKNPRIKGGNTINPEKYAHIGFYSMGDNSSEFRSIHGKRLTEEGFSDFCSNEPNNINIEICGTIQRNLSCLNDMYCHVKHPFICEKKPNI